MSKRAEELARAVAKSVSDAIHTPIVLDIYGSAVDIIDAELRKAREAFAKRITDDLAQDSENHTMFRRSYITERIYAILSEGE